MSAIRSFIPKKIRSAWNRLNIPQASDPDDARREYMTRVLCMITGAVALLLSILFGVGSILGKIPADSLIIALVMSGIFWGGWVLASRGYWKIASYFPPALCFLVGVYGTFVGGIGAPAVIFYALAIVLAGMLQGSIVMVMTTLLVSAMYTAVYIAQLNGLIFQLRNEQGTFYNRIVLAVGAYTCLAALIWFLISRFNHSERSLRKLQVRMETLFEETPAITAVNNMEDGRYLMVNKAFEQATGYSRWEVIGRDLVELDLFDRSSDRERLVREVIQNDSVRNSEIGFRNRDGQLLVGLASSVPVEMNDSDCLLTAIIDITERKRMQVALRESQEQLRTVVSNLPVALLSIDHQGVVILAEGESLRSLTNTRDVTGQSIYELFRGQPGILNHIGRALGGATSMGSVKINGHAFDFSFEPHIDPDGRIEGVIGVASDVTGRVDAEDALRSAHLQLELAYDRTLAGWARALELREHETAGHSQRVVNFSLELAEELGVGEDMLLNIRRGALLHDIGKMAIPDSILSKPGPLDEGEWKVMRTHPQLAFDLLRDIPYLLPSLDIPYNHHEKWDGSGYPRGLRGDAIPFSARIFAVVDVWDALTSNRVYRQAWPFDQATDYLRGQSGRHFDPDILDTFLSIKAAKV
jgi:PAS domain S-box-containing protein/putative nucleotidyltransferase with HDIG domain